MVYGSIERYKARLVAKGFHQQLGVDFDETLSLVIKPTTVRTVLYLAISGGWVICQIGVHNAFLPGLLSKDVYMTQPPGFIHPQYPQHLCKLQKALYGLKQAPQYSRLSSQLIDFGFQGSKSDSSLFMYKTVALTMFVLIYVDDIIITCSQPSVVDDLISQLHCDFAIKDLGCLKFFFLGIEILHNSGDTFLSQKRYILDILNRTKMV
jgi:hypothetical protein